MAHPRHEFLGARARGRGERVAGVAEIVEAQPLDPGATQGAVPGGVEGRGAERPTLRSGEDEVVGPGRRPVAR